ncbi:MAG TPA: lysylphosphatidylglycerol synthase transmembrane domain-containing protein [Desulfatiglandales bacterium]|nr:lysylphosphatidylglycerol synthase transmembrane domain-containing protein [Desulfatiglandales bacterium]
MLKLLAKIIFSTSCLFCIFYFGKIDVGDFLHNITKVNLIWLVISYIMLSVVFVIGAIRWKVLLNIESKVLSLGTLIKYYFIGGFFNTFLPSGVGGDVVRAYYLKHHEINYRTGFSSVIIERMLGITALVLLSALSLLMQIFIFSKVDLDLIWYISCLAVMFCVVWAGYFNMERARPLGRRVFNLVPAKIKERFKTFSDAFELMGEPRSKLFKGFLFSFIAHSFTICSVYFLALSLKIQLDFMYCMIIVPLISIISMVPVFISGIGIRESGYVFFLSPLGIEADKALALSILFYFLVVLIGLIGAVLYSLSDIKFVKKKVRTNLG